MYTLPSLVKLTVIHFLFLETKNVSFFFVLNPRYSLCANHHEKRKLWKIRAKNDRPRVTANQLLYTIHNLSEFCIAGDRPSFWCLVKKLLSREIGDETQNAKGLFHELDEYDESHPIHYSYFMLFCIFTIFCGSLCIVYSWHKSYKIFFFSRATKTQIWLLIVLKCLQICEVPMSPSVIYIAQYQESMIFYLFAKYFKFWNTFTFISILTLSGLIFSPWIWK